MSTAFEMYYRLLESTSHEILAIQEGNSKTRLICNSLFCTFEVIAADEEDEALAAAQAHEELTQ